MSSQLSIMDVSYGMIVVSPYQDGYSEDQQNHLHRNTLGLLIP